MVRSTRSLDANLRCTGTILQRLRSSLTLSALTVYALLATLAIAPCGAAEAGGNIAIDSISPPQQRVHEIITLRGEGFGSFVVGVSEVVFISTQLTIHSATPYVWRDDFIQVRVPVGERIDGINQPIPKTPLNVRVIGVNGTSAPRSFKVITAPGALLLFVQRTEIVNHQDVSTFLGDPNMNQARVKDADIGDANGDGFPDIIDSASNNQSNNTHAVLRINNAGKDFSAIAMEPLTANDEGEFATTVLEGGDYVVDSVSYDADFVDLTNDGLPEWVHAAAFDGGSRVRILVNNYLGVPGGFLEDTATWIPNPSFPGSPDDIGHVDVNHDGFVDIAVGLRFSAQVQVFVNDGGTTFEPAIVLSSGAGSMHDVFFIDANHDGHHDVIGVSESSVSRLFLNTGEEDVSFTVDQGINFTAVAGIAADFDADGLADFALTRSNATAVFLNDPDNPGSFTQFSLPGVVGFSYDLEVGDINLDGTVDLIAAVITSDGAEAAEVWFGNGDGTFEHMTANGAQAMFPDLGNYQRLSADLLDFDMDGDLDLYITGGDGQDVGFGFGALPNQFYENTIRDTFDPDEFSAFRGFYDSGDLDSLLASDNSDLCFEPGIVFNPTEAPVTLDFTGTLSNDAPSSLDVTIESSANTVGLGLTFSFWNYNTESWDIVGTDTQSLNADTVRTFAGVPADHVEAGTGEVRTRYEVRVVSFIFLYPWLDCVDHVFWTTSN